MKAAIVVQVLQDLKSFIACFILLVIAPLVTSGFCVRESMTGSHVPLSPDSWMYTVVELILARCFPVCKTNMLL